MYQNKYAFTFIELLVTILIIGVLLAVAIPQYQQSVEKSRATQALALLKTLVQAQKTYYLANGEYADKFEKLDIELDAWTGNSPWSTTEFVTDTRSNGDWSLQIYGTSIAIGRIAGIYKGAGWLMFVLPSESRLEADAIYCVERITHGIAFEKKPGDYCEKLFGKTNAGNSATTYRSYAF